MGTKLLLLGLEHMEDSICCIRGIRQGTPCGVQPRARKPHSFWKEIRPKSEESNEGRVISLDYFLKILFLFISFSILP